MLADLVRVEGLAAAWVDLEVEEAVEVAVKHSKFEKSLQRHTLKAFLLA